VGNPLQYNVVHGFQTHTSWSAPDWFDHFIATMPTQRTSWLCLEDLATLEPECDYVDQYNVVPAKCVREVLLQLLETIPADGVFVSHWDDVWGLYTLVDTPIELLHQLAGKWQGMLDAKQQNEEQSRVEADLRDAVVLAGGPENAAEILKKHRRK
jgi:hypothetical protein